MKIVFWGTSQFAIPSLESLFSSHHEIEMVVTQPDRRKGRHLQLQSPPVKRKAESLNLKVVQPEEIDAEDFLNLLREKNADLFVVVSYGKILDKKILEIPKIYSINLHASILPRYRGAAPINWAILNGEKETGISVIKMNEKMDGGEIISQRVLPIFEDENAISLEERLSKEGAELLLSTIDLIEKGEASLIPQDETKVSFAPLLKKEDGKILWKESARKINNRIRALQPWPGTYCFWKGKFLKIWKAKVKNEDLAYGRPGEVLDISKEGILIATGKGTLLLEELQLAGGKRMRAKDFILGHHFKKGEILDSGK